MILLALTINLLLASLVTAGGSNGNPPIVDLGYVKYQGWVNETSGIKYFQGMRFAQAPIGELRWRAPVPIEYDPQFTGQTLNATAEGAVCIQGFPVYGAQSLYNDLPASEDCLFADVLAPVKPVSDLIPVIVHIHGGGYTEGYNGYASRGEALVNRSNGNVLYVELQYRLGMYGFLGGGAIAQNGDRNTGLLDQRAGLDWIQRHISRFGGDPDKVMITGLSAGAGSVAYQMIAGGGYDQPPFRAVYSQSPWWQVLLNESSQEIQYNLVLSLADCTNLECLRQLPEAQLKTVSDTSYNAGYLLPGYDWGLFWYGPVVDGKFVQQLPDRAFKEGNFYHVPLIVDHGQYEGLDFTNQNWTTQAETVTDAMAMFQWWSLSFISRLFQLYPASDYNSSVFQREQWFGDAIVNCPSYYMCSAAVDRNPDPTSVYKMIFDAGSQGHVASTSFIYSADTGYWTAANNQTLAQVMTDYFLSFAITLNPNTLKNAAAPEWPAYVSGAPNEAGVSVGFQILDVTYTTIVPLEDPDVNPGCDFMAGQGVAIAN